MEIIIYEKSPYAEGIDAVSRVKLFASNAVESDEIVKYGNLTRTIDGGITWGGGRHALMPSFEGGHVICDLQNMFQNSFSRNDFWPVLEAIAAASATGDVCAHCLMLCRKLRLYDRDPDLADGLWKRCYCDDSFIWPPGAMSLNFNNGGVFDCREVAFSVDGYMTIMEAKFFKTRDSRHGGQLLFRPSTSRLWIRITPRPDTLVYITSELGTVLANIPSEFGTVIANPGKIFCWFQNCGALEKMDFSPIRGHRIKYLIMAYPGDPLRTQNAWAEALAFKTAALRNGISVQITVVYLEKRSPIGGYRGEEYRDPQQKELSDAEFMKRCAALRLPIDPILQGNPYEVKLLDHDAHAENMVPHFFDRGRLTIIQEQPNKPSIRFELMQLLSGTKTINDLPAGSSSVLMFSRQGNVHRLGKQMQDRRWPKLKVYTDTALLSPGMNAAAEMKKLLDDIRPELILLEISNYSEVQEKALLEAIDVCLANGVSVGVVGEIGNIPTALQKMTDRELVVGALSDEVFIVKEKTDNATAIRRFDFKSERVSIEDSTEKELAEAMREY